MVYLEPKEIVCSCGKSLKVYKTQKRTIVTLQIGELLIHETIKYCSSCDKKYRSEYLKDKVPHGCKFGFDILVYVGKALFIECRGRKEVQNTLKAKNVKISLREIGLLGKKFILYLAIAHKESKSQIKSFLSSNGGYILSFDGTSEGDSPHLMTGLDSVADIVLSNVKMPSEKADSIILFLQKIKEDYGAPLALVHDMSRGILSAVKSVFPDVKDFICHYHFLRDLGKDLFGQEYAVLQNALKKYETRSSLRKFARECKAKIDRDPKLTELLHSDNLLKATPIVAIYMFINWIFDYKSELNGYGFPFDQSHFIFFQRIEIVKKLLTSSLRKDRYFQKLYSILNKVLRDKDLRSNVFCLKGKVVHFNQLRDAMRIALPDGKDGLNDDGEDADIKTIEKEVTAFRNLKEIQEAATNDLGYKKMLCQLDKYWEKLFADPIIINRGNHKIIIQPQRTNNIMERLFRCLNRENRKRTGDKSLGRYLKSMVADTPLVKNLQNVKYLEIILGEKRNLESRFAEIDVSLVRKEMAKTQDTEKLSPSIKKMLRSANFPEKIIIDMQAA